MSSNVKPKTKKKKEKKISNFYYDFVKVTAFFPTIIFYRPKTICVGKTNPTKIKGAGLISCNHISFADPIYLHCAFWRRRLRMLATKDLYNTKLKTWFFDHMQCIIVDKENFSMRSLHAVCDSLKKGKLVTIFPEGGVNRQDSHQMLSFKSGAALMAFQSNAPIIPACVIPRKHWIHRQVVLVGDPVNIRELCGDKPSMADLNKASEYLREKEMELLAYYDDLQAKKQEKKNKKKSKKEKTYVQIQP